MEEYYGTEESERNHHRSLCYPYKITRYINPTHYLVPINSEVDTKIKNRSREFKGFKLNRWQYPQSGSQHSDSNSPQRKTKKLMKSIKRQMNMTVIDKSTIFNNTNNSIARNDNDRLRSYMREFSPNLTHNENFIVKVDAKLQLDRVTNEKSHYPSTKSKRIQAFLSRLRDEEAPKLISMLASNNSTKNTTERLWDKRFVDFRPAASNQNNIIAKYSSIFDNGSMDLMKTSNQRIQRSKNEDGRYFIKIKRREQVKRKLVQYKTNQSSQDQFVRDYTNDF